MSVRHCNALAIQQGACNPSGIAHSIVDACREIRETSDYSGTAQLTSDPALRLMVHQLAYICGIGDDWPVSEYESAIKACKEAT